MRDHSARLCRHDGVPRTPRVRFRVGLRCTSNVRDLWLLRGEHTSFSGTGSGDSHMLGSAETSQRIACDAGRVVMRHDSAGRIVEIGARTRTIPPALRRALHHRDRGCRFPGCGVRIGEGHHIRHWARGGPTTMSNLAMLCRRHHRAVHGEGYQIEREADGALIFHRPNGSRIPDVPDPPLLPRDPMDVLREVNTAHGVNVDSRTITSDWLGEPLDVGWALDVLHPLALASTAEV
jgi:hypothetical protein